MQKQGTFIVLDASEGAGKTTQVHLLKEHYGDRAVITREPGGSPYAEEMRELILKSPHAGHADARTMFALFWAARADHLNHTIKPALKEGKLVIADRFDSTTFGYQLYGQEARELEALFWTMRKEYITLAEPDTYIFLDIDPQVALERKRANQDEVNHFDEREHAFYERVREGHRVFSRRVPSHFINAERSIEEISKDLIDLINTYIKI